jgi:hypothetical protein
LQKWFYSNDSGWLYCFSYSCCSELIISVGYYFKLILAMYTKNLMKKEQELLLLFMRLPLYNCIEYRFGFISIFSFGLAGNNSA